MGTPKSLAITILGGYCPDSTSGSFEVTIEIKGKVSAYTVAASEVLASG